MTEENSKLLKENKILKGHSQMLGRIASIVRDWCPTEDSTTEDAVRLMLAELYELKSENIKRSVDI